DVKVIMLTALGQSDDQQRANRLGADHYLVKSQVTLEDIVKVTHELLQDDPGAEASAPSPVIAESLIVPAAPAPQPQPSSPTPPMPAPAPDVPPAASPALMTPPASDNNASTPAAVAPPADPVTPPVIAPP